MNVAPGDACCRSCGGPIQIIHVDDAIMLVGCDDCGETFKLEADALGDGCVGYYLPLIGTERKRLEDPDGEPS